MMKVKRFTYDSEKRIFQFILKGNQKEIFEFIGKLNFPLGTNMNYKFIRNEKARVSLYLSTEEEYLILYKNIDSIIQEYI